MQIEKYNPNQSPDVSAGASFSLTGEKSSAPNMYTGADKKYAAFKNLADTAFDITMQMRDAEQVASVNNAMAEISNRTNLLVDEITNNPSYYNKLSYDGYIKKYEDSMDKLYADTMAKSNIKKKEYLAKVNENWQELKIKGYINVKATADRLTADSQVASLDNISMSAVNTFINSGGTTYNSTIVPAMDAINTAIGKGYITTQQGEQRKEALISSSVLGNIQRMIETNPDAAISLLKSKTYTEGQAPNDVITKYLDETKRTTLLAQAEQNSKTLRQNNAEEIGYTTLYNKYNGFSTIDDVSKAIKEAENPELFKLEGNVRDGILARLDRIKSNMETKSKTAGVNVLESIYESMYVSEDPTKLPTARSIMSNPDLTPTQRTTALGVLNKRKKELDTTNAQTYLEVKEQILDGTLKDKYEVISLVGDGLSYKDAMKLGNLVVTGQNKQVDEATKYGQKEIAASIKMYNNDSLNEKIPQMQYEFDKALQDALDKKKLEEPTSFDLVKELDTKDANSTLSMTLKDYVMTDNKAITEIVGGDESNNVMVASIVAMKLQRTKDLSDEVINDPLLAEAAQNIYKTKKNTKFTNATLKAEINRLRNLSIDKTSKEYTDAIEYFKSNGITNPSETQVIQLMYKAQQVNK